ncbi:endonuclease/exonuclease/phosphatase family protein [Pectobacterium polaris]|uniref:endonuclease/exonuclease/phosphatase family protein n=1 Tax=Pectobacterium polaris TaxID=2042057 RepID=UPI001968E56D|nr:endonuclease/exonuclease/phosphatase family protein [Pectobacterium polaris]MBN3216179.1 endonuclease/exonuclease/phosphatase family protein [Pectobacterium polaris]
MSFRFAFWNCAISPPGVKDWKNRGNIADAVEIIRHLFIHERIDLLAVCEVNQTSFQLLVEGLLDIGIASKFMDDTTPTGGQFDIGYFYRSTRIAVTQGKTHTGRIGSSSLKIAQQLKIAFKAEASYEINMLVSHWPSQLRTIAEDFRNKCSIGLRGFVDSLLADKPQVILMGDYNAEPYDPSLFKNLSATNDRALVLSNPDYWLYNPYWKTLSARVPFSFEEQQHDFGTCYSKSGNRNSWSAFDQIIFSGDFLSAGPWYLDEAATGVVLTDVLRAAILDSQHYFDHMPVIGCVRKKGATNV